MEIKVDDKTPGTSEVEADVSGAERSGSSVTGTNFSCENDSQEERKRELKQKASKSKENKDKPRMTDGYGTPDSPGAVSACRAACSDRLTGQFHFTRRVKDAKMTTAERRAWDSGHKEAGGSSQLTGYSVQLLVVKHHRHCEDDTQRSTR
ncbi:hypothetical protein EYF80_001348 [Liparis tanakae]|uniref:Uncharacterized protein n=1 Tax=Liparis tanakae TaxID=230148 RepID=A0A4Z2JE63_9TELE|nr:hypothetical protein EYF80_001348 [Liparis tanakae]